MKCPNCNSDVDAFLKRCTSCGEPDIWRNAALLRVGRVKDVHLSSNRPMNLVDRFAELEITTSKPTEPAPDSVYAGAENPTAPTLPFEIHAPDITRAVPATTLALATPEFLKVVQKGAADKIAALLTDNSTLANTRDEESETMLHIAVQKGKDKVITVLLDSGAEINIGDSIGDTPLHLAVKKGADKLVSLLLSRGAAVNINNNDGLTPLHLAAGKGQLKIATLLVEHPGTDVNALDSHNASALFHAAENGHANVIKLLVNKGASMVSRS